ncbi:HTH-type transcriptional regulator BhcR [Sedimentitalea nanhaiensis]|uniref:Transcriptional regulator, IclR family n=1 Tax=Sedimentitalea nanhaiensis TaxID=999627 RepID=A0A1I6Z450_9RHOB|nr:HTH-type transcriptional regulator BhcR [Sedimentitalea nanhaiensis]SFT57449.1 transcriptional regulator, IclR family [Sedimentitalea nanhaiensis]
MKPTARRKGRPKAFDSKPTQTTIQSLDRALEVLDTLALENGMTLTEVSDRLKQSPATMYRVLSTLQARGFVEIDAAAQTWHIGAMAFRLGSAFLRRSGVVDRSRPVMRDLMEATGETSNLGIERDGEVMFIGQVETTETIRAFFPPGTLSPMHASGIGKALLSQRDADSLGRFLRTYPLNRFTDKTIGTAPALQAELTAIRQQGYAFDDEERTAGMRCVAAPILNLYGEAIAGISVSGPTHRMPADRIREIGRLVQQAANTVSRGLGAPEDT